MLIEYFETGGGLLVLECFKFSKGSFVFLFVVCFYKVCRVAFMFLFGIPHRLCGKAFIRNHMYFIL